MYSVETNTDCLFMFLKYLTPIPTTEKITIISISRLGTWKNIKAQNPVSEDLADSLCQHETEVSLLLWISWFVNAPPPSFPCTPNLRMMLQKTAEKQGVGHVF